MLCVSVQMTESGEYSLWEYLLTTRPGIGWVKGTASLTGVVLQVLICLMVLCSSTFVRRSGHFEVTDTVFSVCVVCFLPRDADRRFHRRSFTGLTCPTCGFGSC